MHTQTHTTMRVLTVVVVSCSENRVGVALAALNSNGADETQHGS
jgi:hypothetical protein